MNVLVQYGIVYKCARSVYISLFSFAFICCATCCHSLPLVVLLAVTRHVSRLSFYKRSPQKQPFANVLQNTCCSKCSQVCWNLFFNKVAGLQHYLNKTPTQAFSSKYCKIFKNSFFLQNNSGGCFFTWCNSNVNIRSRNYAECLRIERDNNVISTSKECRYLISTSI